MDVKHISFSDRKVVKENIKETFVIEGAHVGLVNAVRRVILSEIPNVAVGFHAYEEDKNDCQFHTNTCSLHNEFLGHRISLIPVHLPPDVIDRFTPDMFRFEIEIQNTENEVLLVTSEHIKVFDKDGAELAKKQRDKMFPPDPITGDFILLTKLKPNLYDTNNGEKLHVEFRARKGVAKDNAAWCPVSLCSYTFVVDDKAADEALAARLSAITDEDERNQAQKTFQTLDRQRYYYKNSDGEPVKYKFALESECAMPPAYLFGKAFDVLVNKLVALVEERDKYEVRGINEEQHLYAIIVNDEDHTLGNLLQIMIYENYIRAGKGVTYAGYNMPHPLEKHIVVKVRFDRHTKVADFLADVVSSSVAVLKGIKESWEAFLEGKTKKAVVAKRTDTTKKPVKAPPKEKKVVVEAPPVEEKKKRVVVKKDASVDGTKTKATSVEQLVKKKPVVDDSDEVPVAPPKRRVVVRKK